MYRILDKVLLLLAGSGLSHKDICELVVEIRDLPARELADAIMHVRRNALSPLKDAGSMLGESPKPHGLRRPHRPASDVRSRVEFLLREEAGLTVNRAASELLTLLKRERPGVFDAVKAPNKESLYNWLLRVSSNIEPSELLHHATLIRNKYVHNTDSDWPLLQR